MYDMKYTGRFKTSNPDRYFLLKELAKQNRRNQTLAEKTLWENIRGGRVGHKFYRQHIIADYIVDFLCHDDCLIIEIDGAYHEEREQMESDELRTQRLEKLGYRVIRFKNEEVIADVQDVVSRILDELKR